MYMNFGVNLVSFARMEIGDIEGYNAFESSKYVV